MSGNLPEIEKMQGVRFSDQGRTIHLQVVLGGRLAEISMPSSQVPDIHSKITGAMDALLEAGILKRPPGPAPTRQVQTWKLGGNTFQKNLTALLIDEGLSTEILLVFPDLAALQIADAIEQKVLDGLSLDDQKKLMEAVERSTGRKPRIILPGGRRPH